MSTKKNKELTKTDIARVTAAGGIAGASAAGLTQDHRMRREAKAISKGIDAGMNVPEYVPITKKLSRKTAPVDRILTAENAYIKHMKNSSLKRRMAKGAIAGAAILPVYALGVNQMQKKSEENMKDVETYLNQKALEKSASESENKYLAKVLEKEAFVAAIKTGASKAMSALSATKTGQAVAASKTGQLIAQKAKSAPLRASMYARANPVETAGATGAVGLIAGGAMTGGKKSDKNK